MFYNFLRMYPAQFDALLSLVQCGLQKFSIREAISPGERLCITLRYLASGMTSLSYLFRVAISTISCIVFETCSVLWNILSTIVFDKPREETWWKISEEFETRWNFPHCIGALDGKHCMVQAFANSGSEYFNHKRHHSLILLALVSADYKFVIVDIGAAGRHNDAGVFNSSMLGQALREDTLKIPPPSVLPGTNEMFPYTMVGDAAFQLKTNLMRPYGGEFLPPDKLIFNYRLSRARNVVENAFGILASRWRI
ncbi:uncharacterized protein LOC129780405 [Toxorhynchites rutilus septentrionalis]|uniref:uncharacterized protein LOC129780405 n=1 Tax=Toxorhynchites rutilus septentrionalis TaxID=329112 RepID=UPI00247A550B|nr:uncharacterized protein LOC129780405 [Toxorhynchites rutilus septentrionalis]